MGNETIKTSSGEVFYVVQDERGRDLIKTMKRESVSVFGTVTTKNGRKWLMVLDYTEAEMAAAHELWRRMRCNACVVSPAIVNASAPKNLRGARAISGRYYSFKEQFRAWCFDAGSLWVATDNTILQIDMDDKRLVRTYGRKEGLPNVFQLELPTDGQSCPPGP